MFPPGRDQITYLPFAIQYLSSSLDIQSTEMIINVILSVAFLWTCRRCLSRLKQIAQLRKIILSSTVHPVSQALKRFADLPSGSKIFMIVRGLVKAKRKLQGEKSIYSVIQSSSIRKGRLGQHFIKNSWDNLTINAFWKQPFRLENTVFKLQDMNGLQEVEIRGIKQNAISGALNEILRDVQKYTLSDNLFVSTVKNVYNFFVSRAPYVWLFKPTIIGEELTLYSIQDGQYSLAIGEFYKDLDGHICCQFPHYLTKQLSYVNQKLKTKQNRLCLITGLLVILLTITGVKLIRQVYSYFKNNSNLILDSVQAQQERSDAQGDNCNCTLCYSNIRNIIFKPCRHYAICKSCLQQLPQRSSCPFCKIAIQGIIEVIKKK